MKMVLHILPAFLFTLIFATCYKSDTTPNPNSFYFQAKINGQIYTPNGCTNCLTCLILRDTILILGGNNGFQTLGFEIHDTNKIHSTTYNLSEMFGKVGDYKNGTDPSDRYFTDYNHKGILQITELDKTNKMIKGLFHFSAFNTLRNDSVTVTDGQFRLRYSIN